MFFLPPNEAINVFGSHYSGENEYLFLTNFQHRLILQIKCVVVLQISLAGKSYKTWKKMSRIHNSNVLALAVLSLSISRWTRLKHEEGQLDQLVAMLVILNKAKTDFPF